MSYLLGPSKGRASVWRFPRNALILPHSNGRSNVTSAPAARDPVETRSLQSILIANRGEIALSVETLLNVDLQAYG